LYSFGRPLFAFRCSLFAIRYSLFANKVGTTGAALAEQRS
jgi:hypothetical protein